MVGPSINPSDEQSNVPVEFGRVGPRGPRGLQGETGNRGDPLELVAGVPDGKVLARSGNQVVGVDVASPQDVSTVATAAASALAKANAAATPAQVVSAVAPKADKAYVDTALSSVATKTEVQAKAARDYLALNVRDYGTKVNGAGDAVAGFLAAFADARDAIDGGDYPGAELFVPRAAYSFVAQQSAGGQNWHVPFDRDRIRLRFERGAVISTAADASPFFFGGALVAGGPLSWPDHWLGDPTKRTYYPFAAGAVLRRDDQTVTLATPADASHFAVGDAVHIRTGQVTNANALSTEPDAEISEVAAVDSTTGKLLLRWPLTKDYQQEWYVGASNGGLDGNAGKTDLNNRGGANHGPAIFGIANVQSITQRDIGVEGLELDAPGAARYGVMVLGAVIGLDFTGFRGRLGGSVMNAIEYRFARIRDLDVQIVNQAAGSSRWGTTTATSCSDIEIENVNVVGKGGRLAQAHFHEGTANLRVRGYRLTTDAGQNDVTPYSIRGRAYNQQHEDIEVVSGGTQTPIYVSPECGDPRAMSSISGKGRCADATRGIRVEASGWRVSAHHATPVRHTLPTAGFVVPAGTAGGTAPAVPMESWEYAAWVTPGAPTAVLGPIPDNTTLRDAEIHVQAAVAGTGTTLPRVSVGWDGNEQALVVRSSIADLGSTGPRPVAFNTDYFRAYQGPSLPQPRVLKAFLTWTGTTPTAGKVRVAVTLRRDPETP